MPIIRTKDDWAKVRKLARAWYGKYDWFLLSTKLIWVVMIVTVIMAFTEGFRGKWLIVTAIAAGILYAREEKIEGYVDGWNQGQDYVIEKDSNIDDLLDFTEGRKKDKIKGE